MLLAAGLALALKPAPSSPDRRPNLEQMIPAEINGWHIDPSVIPIPPSPDVQKSLDKLYDQIVSRTYVNDRGERIMLAVAYGSQQSDTLKAHRQEVCYAAQGFSISALRHETLRIREQLVPATRMVATNGQRVEPVTYWFTMGNQVVLDRYERLMVQLRYGLSGEIPDGMLVRVSNLSTDAGRAYAAHDEFIRQLLGAMSPQDAARFIGGL